VSALLNRRFHWREMRVKFYPVLNDIHSAYMIRMRNPKGRYWEHVIGRVSFKEDEEFIEHRSNFIVSDLIQFNELREVRKLRREFMKCQEGEDHTDGKLAKYDLEPERKALSECLSILHKKLDID
jgi:hypothetical protein